ELENSACALAYLAAARSAQKSEPTASGARSGPSREVSSPLIFQAPPSTSSASAPECAPALARVTPTVSAAAVSLLPAPSPVSAQPLIEPSISSQRFAAAIKSVWEPWVLVSWLPMKLYAVG